MPENEIMPPPPPLPQVVAFANHKGGVGKTTAVLALTDAARSRGLRVLVVDTDPNATCSLALDSETNGTTNDVIYTNQVGVAEEAINPTSWGDLVQCIPATPKLQDRNKDTGLDMPFRLLKGLQGPALEVYDLILIDCQPAREHLLDLALIASRYYVTVGEPGAFSNHAVAQLLPHIQFLQRSNYNPSLEWLGFILNRVPPRPNAETAYRLQEVHDFAGDELVWQPFMPSRVAYSNAQGDHIGLRDLKPRNEYVKEVIAISDTYLDRLLKTVKKG